VDESRRLAIRRAHTKHRDCCTCGMVVHGNGGRYVHTEMHKRRKDGHHAVTWTIWPHMFPGHDGRKPRAAVMTVEEAVAAEEAACEARRQSRQEKSV